MLNIIDSKERTWIEISLDNLSHNLELVKQRAGCGVMCIVKANAYGHGAVECAMHMQKRGATAFGVATVDEAMELRDGGVTLPILVLGYVPGSFAKITAEHDITLTVPDEEAAMELSRAATAANVTVKAHVKLDTGMGRVGFLVDDIFSAQDALNAIERICSLPGLAITGLFSHLSVADSKSGEDYTNLQIERYIIVADALKARGIEFPTYHIGNSAAVENYARVHDKGSYFNLVRVGISLYGLTADMSETDCYRPVMTLKSRVRQVKMLPPGSCVSYGRAYEAKQPITCAVIAVGYADGYPWRISGQGSTVVIRGKQYPIIGRVCMDMMMADVTGSDIERGDEVIIFGEGGTGINDIAKASGTINYEIITHITPRVARVYTKDSTEA